MAFRLESTYDGAGTVVDVVPLTDSEAASVGEAVVFSSGKVTKAGATATPQAVVIQNVVAGTGKTVEVVRVRQDQVFLADYVGTATPLVGAKYAIDATGLNVDADVTDSGKVEIVSVDATKKQVRCKFV